MKERILSYRSRIDKLLEKPDGKIDWKDVMEEHLVQIGFFQHERHVHLIVMVLVALLFVMSIGIALTAEYLPMLGVSLLLLVLLVPYIMHYYLLENEVQAMYRQYDKILGHIREEKAENDSLPA